jgi:formate hydrogenlyase subunit 3/multisubunit Na+/H+ antiporter MnhD subunit
MPFPPKFGPTREPTESEHIVRGIVSLISSLICSLVGFLVCILSIRYRDSNSFQNNSLRQTIFSTNCFIFLYAQLTAVLFFLFAFLELSDIEEN